jgi:hypothetical protein
MINLFELIDEVGQGQIYSIIASVRASSTSSSLRILKPLQPWGYKEKVTLNTTGVPKAYVKVQPPFRDF